MNAGGMARTVLVTGGAVGIGAEISRALIRDGAKVVIHFNSSEGPARALADELGPRAQIIGADLSDKLAVDSLWDRASEVFGELDVLVNNAGAWISSPITPVEAWVDGWNRNLALNLEAPAALSRYAIEDFRKRGGGAIISITSRSAHRGDDAEHLAYGVAKAGLHNLMKGIARGYAHEGIMAYSVSPGWVDTGLAAGEVSNEEIQSLPMREVTPPEEVGEIVAFLASGRARHLTGSTLDITGADYVR